MVGEPLGSSADSRPEGTVSDLLSDWIDELDQSLDTSSDRIDRPAADARLVDEGLSDEGLSDERLVDLLSEHLNEQPTADLLWADAQPPVASRAPAATWYLGIDLGSTGISAVLLNRSTCQLYPLYWTAEPNRDDSTAERRFRLPAIVTLASEHSPPARSRWHPPTLSIADLPPQFFPSFNLQQFKAAMKLGIPYRSSQSHDSAPVLQWSDQHAIPLSWMQQALQTLLTTLTHALSPSAEACVCGALGLETQEFQAALRQLVGVLVGYPAHCSDTYSFNLREAILAAGLVLQPEQVFFLEEPIATLLSLLPAADGREIHLPQQGQAAPLANADWQGNTLVLNAGASVTELGLVNLPPHLSDLRYSDFTFRSLAYAGDAIDQDIVCQLLYPALQQQFASVTTAAAVDLNLEAIDLASLHLEDLNLPTAGEPDPAHRYRLQQRLQSSPSGLALLETARSLKLLLQHQNRVTLQCASQQTVLRQDLASQVLLPYVQRLNRELNILLGQTNTPPLAVNQVVCTGGTASLGAIARWLRQKLPNATIVQDTYALNPLPPDNCIPSCSRVAYGLATLPLHPQVLDRPRQQYSDYFLLVEILRAFPNHPVTAREMMQVLEWRGIRTQDCESHILSLLEGHLPPGLVPTDPEAILLTPDSRQNPDYRLSQMAPLFEKQADQTYRPNREQWNRLCRYLDALLASKHQKLLEPLSVSIEV